MKFFSLKRASPWHGLTFFGSVLSIRRKNATTKAIHYSTATCAALTNWHRPRWQLHQKIAEKVWKKVCREWERERERESEKRQEKQFSPPGENSPLSCFIRTKLFYTDPLFFEEWKKGLLLFPEKNPAPVDGRRIDRLGMSEEMALSDKAEDWSFLPSFRLSVLTHSHTTLFGPLFTCSESLGPEAITFVVILAGLNIYHLHCYCCMV